MVTKVRGENTGVGKEPYNLRAWRLMQAFIYGIYSRYYAYFAYIVY